MNQHCPRNIVRQQYANEASSRIPSVDDYNPRFHHKKIADFEVFPRHIQTRYIDVVAGNPSAARWIAPMHNFAHNVVIRHGDTAQQGLN